MSAQPSVVWVGDRLVARDQATVPLDDFAARYGAACFETMLARHGRVFRLTAHLDRLAVGLRGMGVQPPPVEVLRAAIAATLHANGLRDASVRLVVSAGSAHAPDLDAARGPLLSVTADPLAPPAGPAHLRIVGVRLDERRPLLGAKTANFLPYLLARQEARQGGAEDALLLNHAGDVVESATANVFVLLRGVLVTPRLADGPIAGITRATVIEVARALGQRVEERCLAPAELSEAEAVVLTNSLVGFRPVAHVEGVLPASPVALDWRAADALPLALTQLGEAYQALVEHECAVAGADGGA